jgi:uncharacterized damage-inducible protein DinB
MAEVGKPREVERIVEQLRMSFEGGAWAGPSVREALDGVNVVKASQRAFRDGYTIWQLTDHLAANEKVVFDRLHGSRFHEIGPAELWAPQPYPTEAAWAAALKTLEAGHLALRQAVAKIPDEQLYQPVPTREHTWYDELHGTVQHNFYHAGQIALLKKALR